MNPGELRPKVSLGVLSAIFLSTAVAHAEPAAVQVTTEPASLTRARAAGTARPPAKSLPLPGPSSPVIPASTALALAPPLAQALPLAAAPTLRTLPTPALAAAPAPVATVAEVDAPDNDDLATRVRDLEQQLEQTRELVVNRHPVVTVSGYADFGFFAAQGDGSGIVRDTGNTLFPEYRGQYGWVFLGDILAPTVNSRGEVADLGDAAGASRFDSIHSRGAPGFIANEVNLTLNAGLGERVLSTASINFMPRSGHDFSIGDFMEVDIAQIEWMPFASGKTSVFVGKFDSVLGIEYRDRKSTQRFGVTPSLIARYTTGTALGLKVRSKFGPDDLLIVAGAITNGSNTTEQFHFYDEIDSNTGKTASGRVALHFVGPFELEIGASGAYGAQDHARDSQGKMWFVGGDAIAHFGGGLDLKAEYLKGEAPGQALDSVYGLKLHNGAYLELDWMLSRYFGVLGRGEYRDAFVWLGDASAAEAANRAYLTKSWRATVGVKAILHQRIALKAEYLKNGEYGGIPKIANDVFTSSLLFSF